MTLVAGPVSLTTPAGVERIDVVSARDMDGAVQNALDAAPFDLFIGVAAVADWRPAQVSEKKLKKVASGQSALEGLSWQENPDILARVCARPDVPLAMGFAAETEDANGEALVALARGKCLRKGAYAIVGNDARAALGNIENAIHIVTASEEVRFGPVSKMACARFIIDFAARQLAH